MSRKRSTLDERKALGRRLRETAKSVGLTSDEVAERLGIQGGSVRGWWVGRNEPSAERLRQYAELVKVSPGYLLFGVDKEMGPSGSLNEWRLRFADLIKQGIEPLQAIDRITGPRPTGVEGLNLTPQEREVLEGAGPAMRQALSEVAPDWDTLSPADRQLVLELIERLAQRDRSPPGGDEPGS